MKVLILEHDPDIRSNYALFANWSGYEAVTSADGTFLSEHWDVVQTCDIIVIDLLVPMGGLACLELLKTKGWTKPVLLHHTTRWHGDLNLIDLKRVTKTHSNATFKRKTHDGANMVWFLEKHLP